MITNALDNIPLPIYGDGKQQRDWLYVKDNCRGIPRLATEREELRIVRDQVGAPTLSRQIAETTMKILAQVTNQSNVKSPFTGISGTYHMTAAGETTWYDFANAILEEASRMPQGIPWFAAAIGGRPLITRSIIPITTQSTPLQRTELCIRFSLIRSSRERLVSKCKTGGRNYALALH